MCHNLSFFIAVFNFYMGKFITIFIATEFCDLL